MGYWRKYYWFKRSTPKENHVQSPFSPLILIPLVMVASLTTAGVWTAQLLLCLSCSKAANLLHHCVHAPIIFYYVIMHFSVWWLLCFRGPHLDLWGEWESVCVFFLSFFSFLKCNLINLSAFVCLLKFTCLDFSIYHDYTEKGAATVFNTRWSIIRMLLVIVQSHGRVLRDQHSRLISQGCLRALLVYHRHKNSLTELQTWRQAIWLQLIMPLILQAVVQSHC